MASNPSLPSSAPAAPSANESVLSLANLPRELMVSVASFLDIKSLLHLELTSKAHKERVRYGMNPVWKLLRDNRWTHGKLLWHGGPTFERSSDGVLIAVDNVLASWRDEVRRRFELDNSLPGRLARYTEEEEIKEYTDSFKDDGIDINNWLVTQDFSRMAVLCAMHYVGSGRIVELTKSLVLVSQAAIGGDKYAVEYLRNKGNDLSCELVRRCRDRPGYDMDNVNGLLAALYGLATDLMEELGLIRKLARLNQERESSLF